MISKLVNFIFEMMTLRNIKHEGWKFAGIKDPDDVAQHSLGATQIGYILAQMEGADTSKVVKMLIWHDMAETRIGDVTKIGARYITNKKQIEQNIINDQTDGIDLLDEIKELQKEMSEKISKEAIIAKDADYIEMAFQGKIYKEIGHIKAQDWIDNVGKALKTDSAKKLRKQMTESSFADRWEKPHLKKINLD